MAMTNQISVSEMGHADTPVQRRSKKVAPEDRNDPLARRLEEALENAGMSGTAASNAADLSPNFVNQILRGNSKNPSLSNIERLAKVLSVDFDWLAGGEGSSDAKVTVTNGHIGVSGTEMVEIIKMSELVFQAEFPNLTANQKGNIWRALHQSAQRNIDIDENLIRYAAFQEIDRESEKR